METLSTPGVDTDDLRGQVKEMYRKVADEPRGEYHFEMGRELAERLGYPPDDLDRIPEAAVESFAGVGYYFDLANLREGEIVLDLGSGSGMDTFIAARKIGDAGKVIGVDMTDAQLEKAKRVGDAAGFQNVEFVQSVIEDLPVDDASVDVVISNGVINLCPDKPEIFREISRVLKPKGRMAIADIVTESDLPENVKCDASLWAACIGGALRQDRYTDMMEAAGMRLISARDQSEYGFVSKSAKSAGEQYGVKSVCILAEKLG